MKDGDKCIKLYDIGTRVAWYYSPRARCSKNPQYLHADTECMTDQYAFNEYMTLADTAPGS